MISHVSKTLRLGTRGSLLARAQSQLIADDLMQHWPGLKVELQLIQTSGDVIVDRPLYDDGGKGLFTKELEQALLQDKIDFAVHSYKDVPVTMPLVEQSDLIVAAVPKREDPSDTIVMRDPSRGTMPSGARVGTSSLRRRCQILEKIPDAQIEPIRGNIDTRIRKLRDGQFDIIILAAAGLKRSKLFDPSFMQPANLLSAPAQGALALQCRRSDQSTRDFLQALNDVETTACVNAERALVWHLRGDCHSPIAALVTAQKNNGEMKWKLRAAIGSRGGELPILRAESMLQTKTAQPDLSPLVSEVFQQLSTQGVMQLLHGPA
jgi:hydroxymethylbilane synthase